jgi:hypothetical protein
MAGPAVFPASHLVKLVVDGFARVSSTIISVCDDGRQLGALDVFPSGPRADVTCIARRDRRPGAPAVG